MDELYSERAACVAALVNAAESNGWECCWWIDPEEGLDWPIVCIMLPNGQVSWHMSQADFDDLGMKRLPRVDQSRWDGHGSEEKYRRLRECDWGMAPIHHPAHYNQGAKDPDGTATFEPIKVIEGWQLGRGFTIGNALKYVARAPFKGAEISDIAKASWYAARAHAGGFEPPVISQRFAPDDVVKGWGLPDSLAEVVFLLVDGQYAAAADSARAHVLALKG